jgi:Fe-S-cluster containining protein
MPGVLCEHCTGLCCRYIALPIDKPESKKDFDDVRWYLLHGGVTIFVEDGEWYINIETTCRHLQPDNRCGIYETRPKVCRDYSTDNCEYHAGDYGYERHLLTPEDLAAYEREVLAKRGGGKKKRGRSGVRVKRGSRHGGAPALPSHGPQAVNGRAGTEARSTGGPVSDRSLPGMNGHAETTDGRGVPLPVLGAWR